MKIEQKKWTEESGWSVLKSQQFAHPPQLVLVFGSRALLSDKKHFNEIRSMYPDVSPDSGAPMSHVLMCSTAGEISDNQVLDSSLSLTAVYFEKTELRFSESVINEASQSYAVGKKLAESLERDKLVHVMVFSDGLKINGTSLVGGLTDGLPKTTSVTGGLAGDSTDFKETLVGLDAAPESGKVVVVGFYGNNIKIKYGSLGGWDSFGPERVITKAKDNVLYEIDNKPALVLYKEYLGEQAKDLPSSGLLFPMSLRIKTNYGKDVEVVRTLLAVDEKEKSMIFAGDMPVGAHAKLMKANFERLIEGAAGAASMITESITGSNPDLAILISCVGRKLVLKERIEEEIEAIREVLGERTAITGFYSYGEICPVVATEKQCQLHNQTMTITTLSED